MRVAGFAGYSGSGKTTLVEKLSPVLKSRGYRVSVVKHAHHKFDVDQPGKDTFRHRIAGAFEVVAASSKRLALMREFETPVEVTVHQLIAELDPSVDWVLVEGFKESELPKIEIWRPRSPSYEGKPARYMHDAFILAVATDAPEQLPEKTSLPVLDLNDAEAMADFLVDHQNRFDYPSRQQPSQRSPGPGRLE